MLRLALPLAVLAASMATLTPAPASAENETRVPGASWVRVGHFIPGAGKVSIELRREGGRAVTIDMGTATYGQISDYQRLQPGLYTVSLRPTAGRADDRQDAWLSRTFEVDGSQARTVAAAGTVRQPRLALLSDDLTPPTRGTARVRVLSASATAGTVTVAAVDGPTVASDVVLGQATPYATVPAGSWTLRLRGENADATVQDVPISGGSVYTLVALDAGDGVELDVVTDAAGAVDMPRGGAETGLGGTASPSSPAPALAPARSTPMTPGLGAVAAVLAAAGVLLLARRRSAGRAAR